MRSPINTWYQTGVPFGSHSQWFQPWRGYFETMPVSQFLNGVGVVLTSVPDLVCEMLSKYGVTVTRMEIGWGDVTINGTITDSRPIAALQACAKWKIRPIILLNSNQGIPCPMTQFIRHAASDAPVGSTSLTFDDVTGMIPGFTGITTSWGAAQILITSLYGNTTTLSMPLPSAFAASQAIPLATLQYRPFSVPGSQDYLDTMAGWQAYVLTVAKLCTQYLGAGKFDLEIWNELSFGSAFLSINNYYNPPFANYSENPIWAAIVQATVDVANANPNLFAGVELSDGFANTIPWPASSLEPARVTGISKHPYAQHKNYPLQESGDYSIDALGVKTRPSPFVPTYSLFMPEYTATVNQTESCIRDFSPISTPIQGPMHGRNTRSGNPCWGWITECGYDPYYAGVFDAPMALVLKAKAALRYWCFFLNKGCKRVCLFATGGGDTRLGIVQDNFLGLCQTPGAVYPANDASYASPALNALAQVVWHMRYRSATIITPRFLSLDVITDTHNNSQFTGDGSMNYPNLYDRDVLAILPFQSAPNRFIIPYYVMTRELIPALAPEDFTITLGGLNPATVRIQTFDPIQAQYGPFLSTSGDVTFTVTAKDYPCLLIVTD